MRRARAINAGRLLASQLRPTASLFSFTTNACIAALSQSNRTVWRGGVAALHTSCRFASSSSAAAAARLGQRSHYRTLGVDTDATPQEVKTAYRQLALRYHPDVASDERKAQAEVLFRRVSEAYEVLSDPVKRRAHDNELGIQTRRKHSPSTAAANVPGDAGNASSSSGHPLAAAAKGTTAALRRRRRAASASAGGPSASEQQKQKGGYYKPFVRGDANRVFADAFDGKTLDEILFDVQRRRRQSAAAERHSDAASSSSSPSLSSTLPDAALDRDARLRHVMEEAAESFARRAQRQYGHGVLRHICASASALPEGPTPPPASYMPFRPFVGVEVPTGVQAPPVPQLGHVLTLQEATVEEMGGDNCAGAIAAKAERVAGQFHTHRYADGMLHTRMESLRKATKNIEGMPHNMGQLYSYHRPY